MALDIVTLFCLVLVPRQRTLGLWGDGWDGWDGWDGLRVMNWLEWWH